ncbi:MAG: tetratricopeptide repeat protein, partial [Candidatus Hydrogenedentes bacterium]|nr:tetratricopeptide repeat protein [Candidatus Hydrogenedentota bacterium]
MSKGVFSSAKAFVKNVARHLGWVITRKESVGDAVGRVKKDGKKLGHTVGRATGKEGNRKAAISLVRKGRKYYNHHEYGDAEEYFRRAMSSDP